MRNLELPGRSPVIARNGAAATSHYLSTQTAIAVLHQGGNALDAAIAACAVQCVVEPGSTGIGGDCFCLYAPGGGDDYVAYNGSGVAPARATADWYAENGIDTIPQKSPHAVTIPGAVDAWTRLHADHGKLPLAELLAPAIDYARNGFPVSSRVSFDLANAHDLLSADPHVAGIFAPQGRPATQGEILHQPQLADTLAAIATDGRDAFYTGPVADNIARFLADRGGLHSAQDLAEYRGQYVTPIKARYRGYDVVQCPPNGQGVIALMLLKLSERFERDGQTALSPDRIHQEIEAGRLTYHLRDCYLADPDQADVPVDWLLSDAHIDQLYQSIRADQALEDLPDFTPPPHRDTVYITVVDKDRNACSFINTLFHSFGSGLLEPQSGVMLHCRGIGFSLDPAHPNCIAPGKRPLHTIIPGMVAKDGRTVMSYGVMGGSYQAFGHMQFLSRFLQFGYDIQEAQDLPRFFPNPETGQIDIESRIPEDVRQDLTNRGHHLNLAGIPIGGSQAIWIDWDTNTLTAGSDPRKDGCAIGY